MPVLRATNVSMFAERWRNWRHAPVKKPLPSQKTRGVANSHVTHGDHVRCMKSIPTTSNGTASASAAATRRFSARYRASCSLSAFPAASVRSTTRSYPRVADRLPQPFGSGRSRVVLHGDGRCGVVHRSAPDSRLLAERPSHTGGARSAAHAEHGKNAFCHGFVRCHDSVFFVGTKITRPPGGRVTKFGISFTRFGQNGPNGPRKIRRTEWTDLYAPDGNRGKRAAGEAENETFREAAGNGCRETGHMGGGERKPPHQQDPTVRKEAGEGIRKRSGTPSVTPGRADGGRRPSAAGNGSESYP